MGTAWSRLHPNGSARSRSRSEERRVGKSVDLGVTGVQTCALPIYTRVWNRHAGKSSRLPSMNGNGVVSTSSEWVCPITIQIGRASCRKECRSRCDWSSDVCSSDLHTGMESPRWKIITPSQYEWERRGLDFIRMGLPDHD